MYIRSVFRGYLLFALLITVYCPHDSHASSTPYLTELIAETNKKHLFDHPQWHRLLHYEANLLLSGVTSLVDDSNFFLAPNGKTNPRAEMIATIKSFFNKKNVLTNDKHPQCAFIARFHWLKAELNFEPSLLPEVRCTAYDEWHKLLKPHSLTLVFPSAYLNSPASMFGHTFLRIDAKGQNEQTRLLAYAANYGAQATDSEGFLYALKGIFGWYPGYFSITPYYKKVSQYSDIENRDIWEYRLNFSKPQIDLLLKHLWELQPIYFDYFFFDENCSYQLLSLLEVANPKLQLSSHFRFWAIPSDTVRAIVNKQDLLNEAVYRPAQSTILEHKINGVSREIQTLAKDIASKSTELFDDTLKNFSKAQQASILSLSFDALDYSRLHGELRGNSTAELSHKLLHMRSLININETFTPPPVPDIRPEQGHKTQRVSLGIGTDSKTSFLESSYRLSYHDIMDPQGGYVRGGQLVFGDLAFRNHKDNKFSLERIIPVEITSLSPQNLFMKPTSWRLQVGATRKRFAQHTRKLTGTINGGPGIAKELSQKTLTYALLEGALEYSTRYSDNYALGGGGRLGLYSDISELLRVNLETKGLWFGIGNSHREQYIQLQTRFSLSKNLTTHINVSRKSYFNNYWTDAVWSLNMFF